jgi:hypothetical protein
MPLYRILLGIDLAAAAVAVFFFLWGMSDGTVSSFNIGIWTMLLGGIAAIVIGGMALQRSGRTAAANLLLLVLAIPTAGYALFIAMILILQPRWN